MKTSRFFAFPAFVRSFPLILALAAASMAASEKPFTPWKEPPHRVRLEEVTETLRYWSEKHPTLMTVQERGKTASGLPILLAKLTDPQAPDEMKQVLLVTSFHSGGEHSGATSAMRFIEWLTGNDPLAREALRKQVVLVMPVMDPYGFVKQANANESKNDPYTGGRGRLWDIPALRLKDPKTLPEAEAFAQVVDEYRPELHVDLHGIATDRKGRTTPETAGPAGSNSALRPWDSRFDERLTRAANGAGYGVYRMEMDEERLFWSDQMDTHAGALWSGRPFFYTSIYAYLKYHTMPVTIEITWEESALAKLQEIARIGNGVWPTENRPGYPVNVLNHAGLTQLVAWGSTAAEIRKSRGELWERQNRMPMGNLAAATDGRICTLNILTEKGLEAIIKAQAAETPAASTPGPLRQFSKKALLGLVENAPGFAENRKILDFLQDGPETALAFDAPTERPPSEPVRNGLAYRIRIPYRELTIDDLRLNGRLLEKGKPFGYETWYADGFTHLKIEVPPQEAAKLDLCLISGSFSPAIRREQGWAPPAEVVERLKRKQP